ncbi:MAG: hypothetical protein GXO63_02890 [Candidatus Micrarchaeota archaeon]|nr:hypothetical protein [Candidatus Micrarchaeota archaeon]
MSYDLEVKYTTINIDGKECVDRILGIRIWGKREKVSSKIYKSSVDVGVG